MGITAAQKAKLNRMNRTAADVQLGTLIEGAESVAAGEIALANGKVLIGNASGVGAAVSLSGDVTTSNSGVTAIGAAKVAKSMLAASVRPSHMIVYAGTFATAGGDAAETIAVSGALATDTCYVTVKTAGAIPRSIVAAAVGADEIAVTLSGDPDTDHVLQYQIVRATS